MTYEPFSNSVAGRAMAELRRNGRSAEHALAEAIDTDVDTLRSSVWHAEQDHQVRREKVLGLWWYELMVPVQAAAALPAAEPAAPPEPSPRVKPYVPRPGGYAARTINYLREHGATQLSTLAAHFGISGAALKSCLIVSADVGLIVAEKRGTQLWYRVDAQQAAAGTEPLESDTEPSVCGTLDQAELDKQERDAQDRLLAPSPPLVSDERAQAIFDARGLQLPRELMSPATPSAPARSEIEKRLRATIQELESALAARDERIAALLEQSAPAEQPADLRVTLSVTGSAHQAERISAFVRSMTEVRT